MIARRTGAIAADRPYSVNGQNQYTAIGPAALTYDLNGNLASDGSTSFVYDVENRLVSATGTKNAALAYDPLGRLWEVSSQATGITRFNYDDDALVDEYDGSGTLVRRYVHGPAKGVDDPLLWYDNITSGWRRALVSDQQGSIIAVADMHGNAIAINAYDEYGIPRSTQTSAAALATHGRFQYTGQAWIPELGLYYCITIRTYGEGNAWEQSPLLEGFWKPQVERVWKGVDYETSKSILK